MAMMRIVSARQGNQKGQLLIEAVLLLSLGIILWAAFMNKAKSSKWFESIVSGPWMQVSGMIENGVWADPQAGRKTHANQFYRVGSPEKIPK